jgi:hypothetical protein
MLVVIVRRVDEPCAMRPDRALPFPVLADPDGRLAFGEDRLERLFQIAEL